MKDFSIFIDEIELIDFPCIGGRLTWHNGYWRTVSILDIFLLSKTSLLFASYRVNGWPSGSYLTTSPFS